MGSSTFEIDISFSELKEKVPSLIAQIDNSFFKEARWFQQKNAVIKDIAIVDNAQLLDNERELLSILILEFKLLDKVSNEVFEEKYYFPLLLSKYKLDTKIWIEVVGPDYQVYGYDGVHKLTYVQKMESFIRKGDRLELETGGKFLTDHFTDQEVNSASKLTDVSSNSITSVKEDEVVKTFRRLQPGINPDLEIGLNLQQKTDFDKFPRIKGYTLYQDTTGKEYNINLIQEFIESEGDLWAYTQDYLAGLFDYIQESKEEVSQLVADYNNDYCKLATNIGETIADLHLALASIDKEEFKPRSPREDELQKWTQEVKDNFYTLRDSLRQKNLPKQQDVIGELLAREDNIDQLIEVIFELGSDLGYFMRCHGDLHLEQLLKQGSDIIVLDFEGEPTKSISERRSKCSPLKDIAGLLRSYNYAAYAGYFNNLSDSNSNNRLLKAIGIWEEEVVESFLESYLKQVRRESNLLPTDDHIVQSIALYKLEKALYEGLYEVNNRPSWLKIPLQGIVSCLADLK
ncbi:hypothetical protein JCM16358_00520 [Halanaerocella petrolearia]